MGHTATHLMHQALRDVLGNNVHQTGSNITTERIRFDFNYKEKLSDEQIKIVENAVNEKIKENLPVTFEMIPTKQAKEMGAIGLFEDTMPKPRKFILSAARPKTEKTRIRLSFAVARTLILHKS
jgi:alanyl-tRNA synthetase